MTMHQAQNTRHPHPFSPSLSPREDYLHWLPPMTPGQGSLVNPRVTGISVASPRVGLQDGLTQRHQQPWEATL